MIEWDFLNWQTMIIELVIGGSLAGYFFHIQKKQGKKIEKIVNEQEEFRKNRYEWSLNWLRSHLASLYSQIQFIIMKFDEAEKIGHYPDDWKNIVHEKDRIVDEIEYIVSHSVGVLDPQWLNETREISKLAKDYVYVRVGEQRILPRELPALLTRIEKFLKELPNPPV